MPKIDIGICFEELRLPGLRQSNGGFVRDNRRLSACPEISFWVPFFEGFGEVCAVYYIAASHQFFLQTSLRRDPFVFKNHLRQNTAVFKSKHEASRSSCHSSPCGFRLSNPSFSPSAEG